MRTTRTSVRLLLGIAVAATACSPTSPTTAPTVAKRASSQSRVTTTSPSESPTNEPSPTPSPSETSTASPTATPTATPTASATPTATASPTPTPSPLPSLDPGTTLFSGKVYDEAGAPIPSATLTIASLNNSVQYQNTVTVTNGSYVVKGAPAGVVLQVTVTKPGYTTRSRVMTLLLPSQTQPNLVDFGGPTSSGDPLGPSYFISDYPEVTAVTPLDQSAGIDPTLEAYSLTLSEPLDVTNQRLFSHEIRIWPANKSAAPLAQTAPVLLDGNVSASLLQSWPLSSDYSSGNYAIEQASTFGDLAAGQVASVDFGADGMTATLRFAAPLLTSNAKTAPLYQIGLVYPGGASEVVDSAGHALGTGSTGTPGSAPTDASASLIDDAFENAALTGNTWASTHTNVTSFSLAKDTTAPTLVSVDSTLVGGKSQIRLSFSEPMAAYGGDATTNGEYLASSTANPSSYRFAFGAITNDVAGVDLTQPAQVTTSFAQVATGTPVVFDKSAVSIDVDPNAPNVVRITANDELPAELGAFAVRVLGVQDPAGNTISDDGTSNAQTGAI